MSGTMLKLFICLKDKMKIYRIAQSKYYNIYDVYEAVNEQIYNIVSFFLSRKPRPKLIPWNVFSLSRFKKIYRDSVQYGVVHDIRGLNDIIDLVLTNLAKMEACTMLSGHSQSSLKDIFESVGLDESIAEQISHNAMHPFWDYLNTKYGAPYSDFALNPLWNFAHEIFNAENDEYKLIILDKMLNVIHMRGDIASLFIEGGSDALSEISQGIGDFEKTYWDKVFFQNEDQIETTETADTTDNYW